MDTLRCFEVCVFHSERQEVYVVISKEQDTNIIMALMETGRSILFIFLTFPFIQDHIQRLHLTKLGHS